MSPLEPLPPEPLCEPLPDDPPDEPLPERDPLPELPDPLIPLPDPPELCDDPDEPPWLFLFRSFAIRPPARFGRTDYATDCAKQSLR